MINLGTAKGAFSLCQKVCFETSNLCNYCHKKCPASLYKEKIFLPYEVVRKSLESLSEIYMDWNGLIAFHNYNEPLEDPRLFSFIGIARYYLPFCGIQIWTNGSKLTQGLLDEMIERGVTDISVSIYSDSERQRIGALDFSRIKSFIHSSSNLDDRLDQYDDPIIDLLSPCHQPFRQIVVRHYGKIALCCKDWDGDHDFDMGIEEFLGSKEAWDIYLAMSAGKRTPDLCRRCEWRGR